VKYFLLAVRKAQVSGWGYTMKRESGTGTPAKHFPNKLQEANIRVFTVEECYGFYGRFANMKPLIDAGLIWFPSLFISTRLKLIWIW